MSAEHHQADRPAIGERVERQHDLRLTLAKLDGGRIAGVVDELPDDEQVKGRGARDGDVHQSQPGGEQRQLRFRWLEEDVQSPRNHDVGNEYDDEGGDATVVERLIVDDVAERRCRVVRLSQPFDDEEVGVEGQHGDDDVREPGEDGGLALREVGDTAGHLDLPVADVSNLDCRPTSAIRDDSEPYAARQYLEGSHTA